MAVTFGPAGRLSIAASRLPVTARIQDGGLATGVRPWHQNSGGLWIGWLGELSQLEPAGRDELDARWRERGIVPVHLSRDVNAVFADRIAAAYRPGDRTWIHDYQLMLLPQTVRDRVPGAASAFFLDILFPSSEHFRTLPWRRELLGGLLGADLIGCHTLAYMRHVIASLVHVAGIEVDIARVRIGDRDVSLGVFPMGVDAEQFAALAANPDIQAAARAIRDDAGGRQIILGWIVLTIVGNFATADRGERYARPRARIVRSGSLYPGGRPIPRRGRRLPGLQAPIEESVGRIKWRVRVAAPAPSASIRMTSTRSAGHCNTR